MMVMVLVRETLGYEEVSEGDGDIVRNTLG